MPVYDSHHRDLLPKLSSNSTACSITKLIEIVERKKQKEKEQGSKRALVNMAEWRGERRSLSPSGFWSDQEWDADPGRRSFRHTLRSLSPLALSDLDFWDRRSLFKARKPPAWSCVGSTLRSKISTSQKHEDSLGMTRWSSASRLAPEGASRSHCSSEDFELRAALEESSMRRAELIQKLREAKGHLDTQTDLMKTKGSQLQQNQNFLEMKNKQLSEAVSALEQDKEAAALSRFEESHRRAELHDKVLQLELDILKMRSNLERRSPPTSPDRALPATKDQTIREGQRQVEKEVKKLREALRKAEERTDDLEYEKESALKQLHSSEECKQEAIKQAEELEQRLSSSIRAQTELEDRLNESRSRLGQMELEKDLFSTKILRLEDNLNELKVKLSGVLMDKDRLVQENGELHQRIQTLDLQWQREQRSKQGFSEEMCELHSELSQAKSQASKHKMDTALIKQELLSAKELNEKLSSDLNKATERLQVTLNQLHELEAEKLIQTNQIAALETERLQLIGEKEELSKTFDDGLHEKIRELGERGCQDRDLQENLEQENETLKVKCQDLKEKVQILKAEFKRKEEEQQHTRAGFERQKEELKKVAAHWNERWLDVAMTLSLTQAELDELKSQEKGNDKLKMDEELLQVKAELLSVRGLLKIRDSELEERLQELHSARDQVSQQSDEVQRLEKLLADRDREMNEKDQDLKNLEIQRIREKAEAKIKISALEQQIFEREGLWSRQEGVSECSPEESLKILLEETRRRAERLEEERNQALQKLCDLGSLQQGKAEKQCPAEHKKQKAVGSDLVDPNQQRRLVTEQLKSLFRERERRGERSPVFPRKPGLVDNGAQDVKNNKNWNVVERQQRETQKLDHELQQRAAKGSSSQSPIVSQEGSKRSEGGEEPKQPISMTVQETFPLGCNDGTFHAKQVEVSDTDLENMEDS